MSYSDVQSLKTHLITHFNNIKEYIYFIVLFSHCGVLCGHHPREEEQKQIPMSNFIHDTKITFLSAQICINNNEHIEVKDQYTSTCLREITSSITDRNVPNYPVFFLLRFLFTANYSEPFSSLTSSTAIISSKNRFKRQTECFVLIIHFVLICTTPQPTLKEGRRH